ncbi:MAG: hypothetical protein WCF84_06175 [Anaerolineae bacterium]
MQNFNYTQGEADALVGARFETLVEWDQVAKKRRGHVVSSSGGTVWASQGSYESYEVVIEWDRLPGDTEGELPSPHWFSKFQMQQYMRAVKP